MAFLKNRRIVVLLLIVIGFASHAFAQLEKTIHQTFEVAEAPVIQLNLAGEYEIIPWVGDQILSETHIQLYDATEGILDHFLKTGRYEVVSIIEGGNLKLESKDLERRTMRTKKGEVYEFIKVKIFVPDTYESIDNQTLQLKNPRPATSDKG